jgi:hypothetical protein
MTVTWKSSRPPGERAGLDLVVMRRAAFANPPPQAPDVAEWMAAHLAFFELPFRRTLFTCMHEAAAAGNAHVVTRLARMRSLYAEVVPAVEHVSACWPIAAFPSTTSRDETGATPLHYAVWRGSIATVRALHAATPPEGQAALMNARDLVGTTPLGVAITMGCTPEMVELLCSLGAANLPTAPWYVDDVAPAAAVAAWGPQADLTCWARYAQRAELAWPADLAEERLRHGHASTAEHLKWVLPFLRAKWGSQPGKGDLFFVCLRLEVCSDAYRPWRKRRPARCATNRQRFTRAYWDQAIRSARFI